MLSNQTPDNLGYGNLIRQANEVFPGEFLGQPDGVVFYLYGDDIVMTKPDGSYITTMKGGVNNKYVKRARIKNTKGRR